MTRLTPTTVAIAWEETGEGAPLLLIHGVGYGRWGWEPLVPLLAGRFRVISFDNRGIGESDKPAGPYTAAEMAEDAVAVLDHAGVKRAHVAGTSLGGMIAQELAIAHPQRIHRLVLLSTTPGGAGAHPTPQETVDLVAAAAEMEPAQALRAFVENALSRGAPAELVEAIYRRRLANPPHPEGWKAQTAAGFSYNGGGRAGEITAPTLILHGEEDRVVDNRNAELLASLIPDGRAEVVDGGHLFFWETPEPVADRLISFLGEGR